jgi:radical SAM protein with 4Fe4S-binding SPASM domain
MLVNLVCSALLHDLSDTPFSLEFAVTYRCNLRCVQCNIWKHSTKNSQSSERELSLERIWRIFSSYRKFKLIGITGGEPYLRTDLTEIVDAILSTQKDLRLLFITTNGQLPEIIESSVQKMLERVEHHGKRLGLNHLVSIDGPPDLHDEIRGVPGAHGKALETIRLLSRLSDSHPSLRIGTVTVCSPFNVRRFDEVLDHIIALKEEYNVEPSFCVWLEGQLYDNVGSYQDLRIEEFRRSLIHLVPRIKSVVGSESGISVGRSLFYDLLGLWLKRPTRQIVPCGAARTRYFLDPYGNVYPCTIFGYNMGNLGVFNDDFLKFISSDARLKARRLVTHEECPKCCNTCETIPAMLASPIRASVKWLESKFDQVSSRDFR